MDTLSSEGCGVPAEEGGAAGGEAADEVEAAGDGLVGDVGFQEKGAAVFVALDSLVRLAGGDAADGDCVGTVAEGERGAGAEAGDEK